MALPDLHKFENDLKNRPGPGSNAPPVSIRAKNLDDNFKKVTLIGSDENPPPYTVEYTADGTRLRNIKGLPEGALFKQFDVCENGTPAEYWFVVWEADPSVPQA
jgi:hypothetical protein